jgi:hypothetical protein
LLRKSGIPLKRPTWDLGYTVGAGPSLRRHKPGCLTLRGFRRVSTTEDGIKRLFSLRVRPSGPGSPARAEILALRHHKLPLRDSNAGCGCPILARLLRKSGIPLNCPTWDLGYTVILGGAAL